ncbi:MAG TPA: histidine--tRNA ligase [Candidatus Paceibacterota bacterium]|jgi:histidyl-tRNA synthetase|nr:histidine--tRNA ligase [Candidatus Paceibacterota bacterium]
MTTKQPASKKSQEIASPKGMRDIIGDDYYKFQGFFEKAQEVAVYYGFKPIETPILEHESTFTSAVGVGTDIVDKEMYTLKTKGGDHLAMRPEHTAGLMRSYIENGMQSLPQPLLFYHCGPVFRHDNPQKGRYRQFYQFDVDVIGSEKSIIDALVIRTIYTILEEAGAKNLIVTLNSIGDKESRPAYIRELVNYYKKHINELPAIDQERLKTNPLRILDSKDERTKEINLNAPDSISYLSSAGKKHFKEVLECLDQMDIPYQIDKMLVRGLSYYTHTVFEIIETDEEGKTQTIAAGGRYDYLGKELGSKKDVPAMGGSIGIDRIVEQPWFKDLAPRIMKKPKVYFIQVGLDAKLKSLSVIEILRKAHVPVMQALSKDSLSAQLAVAEKSGCPFTIIFGQKEAMENSVIVRNMDTRSQDNVPISELNTYLKQLK